MAFDFYYKGLSAEDRIYPQTFETAASKAKGTLYEAWFDVLQISPWYKHIAETGEFLSYEANKTWEQFGDLRNKTFADWWRETGYRIFAERVPYQPTQITGIDVKIKPNKNENKPPVLNIEVPLNLPPAELEKQFREILRRQEEYQNERQFNRWDHSTAPVHQYRETKLNYSTIKKWLHVYQEYEKRKDQEGFKLYNFAWEQELHPTLFVGLVKNLDMPADIRIDAANVASDILKNAKYLMANATEGRFPCTDPHDWAKSGTRNRGD